MQWRSAAIAITIFMGLMTVQQVSSGECPGFGGKCSCGLQQYDLREQYVVNCTDQHFEDTDILTKLPAETQVLIFTGNHIPEMPWNVFGTLDVLKDLRVVDMTNNGIKEIKGKTYHHVQNVERLILNHNQLVISADESDENHHHPRVLSNFINLLELHLTNAFEDNAGAEFADDLHDIFVNSNLTKLQKLHLEQNEIFGFRDRRVFCDLPELRDLHLGNNMLKSVSFNISCLRHLRFLDLEANQIETLAEPELALFDGISAQPSRDQAFIVDLRDNPFKCDCSVWRFHSWLKRTNVTVRKMEGLRCGSPRAFSGSTLINLKVTPCATGGTVLAAGTPGAKLTPGHRVTLVLLLVVTLALIALAGLLVYTSRAHLRAKLSPVVEAITKKVQYTSIKNRDNIEDI